MRADESTSPEEDRDRDEVEEPLTEREVERRSYVEGIRYFNEKDFFEAHETWEDAWNLSVGRKRRFYQGMIQSAVTLEHMRRSNPRGVQRVWRTTQQKFEVCPETCMGIHVPTYLEGIRTGISSVLAMPTTRGQQPHDIHIEWSPLDVPLIELAYDPFETGEADSL